MNYRHAYHAGNHADVVKHIVLVRLIEHLKKKDKPFAFLDAHAGVGAYDLQGVEAGKTGEWIDGIGKLHAPLSPAAEDLITPYRSVIAALNPGGGMRHYPGSPEIAVRLLRAYDRIILNELHPEDFDSAMRRYGLERRVSVIKANAEVAIKSQLPPAERRGLVLIDPPYEKKDEAARAVAMLEQGLRRFATGVFAVWYPIKADGTDRVVTAGAAALNVKASLKVELRVREAFEGGGLSGSGLVIVNTPWKADEEVRLILADVAPRLGLGSWGHATVEWLVPPA